MFGTLSLTVLLAVQALVAHANPAMVEVELIKRTCPLKRRSPGDPRLIKRNDLCTTTVTTCPVTPTVTTTTTTTTKEFVTVPTTITTTTTTKEVVYVTVPTTITVPTTTTQKETTTTTTTITTTTCPPTPPPPGNCDLGTAFGNARCCSTALNAAPAICTRWGWYITATSGTTFPITGTLWVGAGLNDISKGTDVGGFTITKTGTSYTITYMFDSGFSATEVHIYAACSKPTTCAPGQFNLSTSPATITLDCPTVYFVLHAKVSGPPSAGGACPTPAT
jgi:hypothetical protein